ncbi:hypothetical protein PP175_26880 (plasmid) [Aneurinibacillus sp. Ricciae_BoGa-3]|uniref:hypothetical protein n=1 Tax=Aneurinibacillus sp. Ricciae_BoGa-3 TaxID=3022697 RepID=UPI0023425A9D|nr:hypothetical protein [Aneurinibacillus sp. Ricciae_BoGa-3]WCK57663.1 hypothetical protein PP175_26880 [Aneurinibacillus sp. Ricciae_BoGa-3]
MLPEWMLEFLHQNPYPSLSFLPLSMPNGQEELVFFYQHEKALLKSLIGKVATTISFYEEQDAYVLRLDFSPIETTEVKTNEVTVTQIKFDSPFVECEFFKNEAHIKALERLSTQDTFSVILYDKETDYISQSNIDFSVGKQALKTFIDSRTSF